MTTTVRRERRPARGVAFTDPVAGRESLRQVVLAGFLARVGHPESPPPPDPSQPAPAQTGHPERSAGAGSLGEHRLAFVDAQGRDGAGRQGIASVPRKPPRLARGVHTPEFGEGAWPWRSQAPHCWEKEVSKLRARGGATASGHRTSGAQAGRGKGETGSRSWRKSSAACSEGSGSGATRPSTSPGGRSSAPFPRTSGRDR